MFGFFKKKALNIRDFREKPVKTMLVDCYERVVGTPMEQGYTELVLYTHDQDTALLERYVDGGLDAERRTTFLVPLQAAQDAFDAIAQTQMAQWNDRKNTIAICGMMYVCKFPDGNGGYIRVSSEAMPEDGVHAFYAVRSAISAYLKDEYRQ